MASDQWLVDARNASFHGAYELPLTDGTDLYGWRVTLSAVFSF